MEKGVAGKIVMSCFAAFACGMLLGLAGVLCFTPMFLSDDRAEKEWVIEGDPSLKILYAAYLFERWESRPRTHGENPYLYPGMSALLKSGRFEDFEKYFQRDRERMLRSPTTLRLMENWINDLMNRGREDAARQYLQLLEAHPFSKIFLKDSLREMRKKLGQSEAGGNSGP